MKLIGHTSGSSFNDIYYFLILVLYFTTLDGLTHENYGTPAPTRFTFAVWHTPLITGHVKFAAFSDISLVNISMLELGRPSTKGYYKLIDRSSNKFMR